MRLKYLVKQHGTSLFLIIISFVFFLLRLPSLVEPYWYGDEGIYEVIGAALRSGRTLYTGIWDNKPPLLYYIYAAFKGNQEDVRLVSLFIGLGTVICFYALAKKLFVEKKPTYIATIFFAIFFGTPILEGNIANAENFMLLPAIGAGLLIYAIVEKRKHQKSFPWQPFLLAGLILGVSFLIKVVALFDFAAFLIFFLIATYTNIFSLKKYLYPLLGFIGGFLLPIFFTLLFSAIHGNLSMFIHSAFLSNVGYVGYANYFIFPQGLLFLKLLLLFVSIVILFLKRLRIPPTLLFLTLWFLMSCFSALFSQRPYTHYLLVLLPSFSLLVGLLMIKQRLQKIFIGLVIITLIIFIGIFSFRPQVNKSIFYYFNFAAFVTGQKSADDYIAFFDNNALRDYKLASFINGNKKPNDKLFVWGNDGQLYKLTNTLPPGRFIVAYWAASTPQTWQETEKALFLSPPRYIVITPHQPALPYPLDNYKIRLMVDQAILYEKVF